MSKQPEIHVDVAVIGGGVAALRSAIAAAEAGARVLLLSKGRAGASGCSAALERGIEYCALNCAPYTPREQELLAEEYLHAGMGVNRRDVVEAFVQGLPEEYERLAQLALPVMGPRLTTPRLRWLGHPLKGGLIGRRGFARNLLGALLHRALDLGVSVLDRHQVVSLARQDGGIRGCVALDLSAGEIREVGAPAVILATGGAGALFPLTTNPADVTGTGVVLAHRCGARLANLEFYSYYPLSVGRARRIYLINPILAAGVVSDAAGEMWEVAPGAASPQINLLTRARDLCRWIEERRRDGRSTPSGGVWWDGRAIPGRIYHSTIPVTYARLQRVGIDLRRERLEIAPHAHQSIGGVEIDAQARSSVEGLFAAGEAAAGLHGALRTNGSGVSSGLVLGAIAGRAAALHARAAAHDTGRRSATAWEGDLSPNHGERPDPRRLRALRERVRTAMGSNLVIRRVEDLHRAAHELLGVREEVEATRFDPDLPALAALREDVRNAAEAASLMVEHSLRRRLPLGVFLPY